MGAFDSLAVSLVPEIGDFLLDFRADEIARNVTAISQEITGAKDGMTAHKIIERNPDIAIKLHSEILRLLDQQDMRLPKSYLRNSIRSSKCMEDVADHNLLRYPVSRSARWAAPIVSVVVLCTFSVVMWAALTRTLPAGSETILNMLLGTLAAMATSVVGYWVGSSAGSERKTDLLYQSTPVVASITHGEKL